MDSATFTITAVNPSPDGRRPWIILGGGQEFKTFNAELGRQAQGMINQNVVVQFSTRSRNLPDGRVFTDRMIETFSLAQTSLPDTTTTQERLMPFLMSEPQINTAKQVAIIRQSSWNVANRLYDHAIRLFTWVMPDGSPIDYQAIHEIAWRLANGSEGAKPPHLSMGVLVFSIEQQVRQGWFPLTDEEVPF